MRPVLLASLVLLLATGLAHAEAPALDEAPIRAALARRAPQLQIERIAPAPLPGMAEVSAGGQVYYVSLDGRHLLHGSLLRTADGVDLS